MGHRIADLGGTAMDPIRFLRPLATDRTVSLVDLVLTHLHRRLGIQVALLPHPGRIGHLAGHLDTYLRRRATGLEPKGDPLIVVSDEPANRTLFRRFEREIDLVEAPKLFRALKALQSRTPGNPIWKDLPKGSYHHELFRKISGRISLTPRERRAARRTVERIGVPSGNAFVCFHSRGSAFLEQHGSGDRDWSYHDHRDSQVENFLPAACNLAEDGIAALRMGAVAEGRFEPPHPLVIDYASEHRTESRDIDLLGACKYFLGDSSGLTVTARALDRPIAATNWVPIGSLTFLNENDLFIPKKLYSRVEGRYLTYSEIIGTEFDSFGTDAAYEAAGLRVEENTPAEIQGLVREMNARLDGTWETTKEDEHLQRKWWSLFPEDHRASTCPARIGTHFLRENRELLET